MSFVCNYPKNETLPLIVDLVPPKALILEVLVWVMTTESVVKIFWTLGVWSGVLL
jgi:hypothetical protein